MSRWYDLMVGPFEGRSSEAGRQALAPWPGETVLEIGFGSGRGLVGLARAVGSSGHVAGVDISRGMCAVARARVRRARLGSHVQLVRGDAASLPFRAAAFDAALLSFTLELFGEQEMPALLAECRRVLRPGGRLCVVAMAARVRPSAMLRLYTWLHERLPQYVDCRPIDIRGTLERAGFRVVSASELSMAGLPVGIVVARGAWPASRWPGWR